jgi:hypothetical protein
MLANNFCEAKSTNIRLPGTCRSANGTVRCQHTFPNTFNITAATFADVSAPNSTSSAYAQQSHQYANTTSTDQTLVRRLSDAVGGLLIASVVLNFFFIPLRFIVDNSNPRSKGARALFLFVFLDFCGQCASVGMVYLIIRKEISGAYTTALDIRTANWPVTFEVGFWLLVAAAAARPLNVILSGSSLRVEPSGKGEAYDRQRGRSSRIKKSKSLRDTNTVDKAFHANLISKLASIIARLRVAVETYPDQEVIDEGCRRLLMEVKDDEKLAYLMSTHFTQHSAALFLGMHSMVTGSPPGPLLWEGCPNRGYRVGPQTRSRGVYLIVLSQCSHGGGSPMNTSEYKYVGSGRSARGGVGLRVAEHTDPGYRNSHGSQLYRIWDNLRPACVAIYLLAEWDHLPIDANPGHFETFDDILLAEAIWQVALQTSAPGYMSDFTHFLRSQVPGDMDLVSNAWQGCNVNSALEKSRWDGNTRR